MPKKLAPRIAAWLADSEGPAVQFLYPLANRGRAIDLNRPPARYLLTARDYNALGSAGITVRDGVPALDEVQARLMAAGMAPEAVRALSWPEITALLAHSTATRSAEAPKAEEPVTLDKVELFILKRLSTGKAITAFDLPDPSGPGSFNERTIGKRLPGLRDRGLIRLHDEKRPRGGWVITEAGLRAYRSATD